MFEEIGLALITGLIIAPLSSYITVQLSLSKFKDEKRWEKQFQAYERLLEALHTIKKNNIYWENALRIDRFSPTTEKLEEIDLKREEAMEFLEQTIDLGNFILPSDIISQIREILQELRLLEYTEENYNECYQQENAIVEKALDKLRSAPM